MGSILAPPSIEEDKALLTEMQTNLEGIANKFYQEITKEVQGSKYIPIHKILSQSYQIRCSVSQGSKIADDVANVANKFIDKKYAEAIGSVFSVALKAMLGSSSASVNQKRGYSIGVGVIGGVIRIDYLIYVRKFNYEGLMSGQKNMALYVSVISSADMGKIKKNDIKTLIDVNYGSAVDYKTKKALYERVLNPIDKKYFEPEQKDQSSRQIVQMQPNLLSNQNFKLGELQKKNAQEISCHNLNEDCSNFKTINLDIDQNGSTCSFIFEPKQKFTLKNLLKKIKKVQSELQGQQERQELQQRGFEASYSVEETEKFVELRSIHQIYAASKLQIKIKYKEINQQLQTVPELVKKTIEQSRSEVQKNTSFKDKWDGVSQFQTVLPIGKPSRLQHFSPQQFETLCWAAQIKKDVQISKAIFIPRFTNESRFENYLRMWEQEGKKIIVIDNEEAIFAIGEQQILSFSQEKEYSKAFSKIMSCLYGGPSDVLAFENLGQNQDIIEYKENFIEQFFGVSQSEKNKKLMGSSQSNALKKNTRLLKTQDNNMFQTIPLDQKYFKKKKVLLNQKSEDMPLAKPLWELSAFEQNYVEKSIVRSYKGLGVGPKNLLLKVIRRNFRQFFNKYQFNSECQKQKIDMATASLGITKKINSLDQQSKNEFNSTVKKNNIPPKQWPLVLFTTNEYKQLTKYQLESNRVSDFVKSCRENSNLEPLAFFDIFTDNYLSLKTVAQTECYRGIVHYGPPTFYDKYVQKGITPLEKISSFSRSQSIARSFWNYEPSKDLSKVQVLFKVLFILKSTTIRSIKQFSIYPSQQEVILPACAFLKCENKKDEIKLENGQIVHYVTLNFTHIPTLLGVTQKCVYALDQSIFRDEHSLIMKDKQMVQTIVTPNLQFFYFSLKQYPHKDVQIEIRLKPKMIEQYAKVIKNLQELNRMIRVRGTEHELSQFKQLISNKHYHFIEYEDVFLGRIYTPLKEDGQKSNKLYLNLNKTYLV